MPRGSRVEVYAALPSTATPIAPPPRPTRSRARAPAPAAQWRPRWIKAEVFWDRRKVTLLATSWFSAAGQTCRRWTPAVGKRMPFSVSLAMKVYHKYFNLTDRFNKKMAAYGMGMPKCKRRYQRQLYIGWEIVAVARNVAVLFSCLWPDMAALRREKKAFGLDRWLQYQSAVVLCEHGFDLEKAEVGSPRSRAASSHIPTGAPRRVEGRVPATPVQPAQVTTHTLVNTQKEPRSLPKPGRQHGRPVEYYTGGGKCASCQALAVELGWLETAHSGRNERPVTTRRMPNADKMPDGWDHVKPDGPVTYSRKACRECTQRQKAPVWLCEGCHKHHWDHRHACPEGRSQLVG